MVELQLNTNSMFTYNNKKKKILKKKKIIIIIFIIILLLFFYKDIEKNKAKQMQLQRNKVKQISFGIIKYLFTIDKEYFLILLYLKLKYYLFPFI